VARRASQGSARSHPDLSEAAGALLDFSLDGAFWRRMARLGARGPEWFARYSPPLIGVAICAFAPGPRRAIASNLRRVRGPRGRLRDAADVARTFATYASCLSEVLGGGSPRGVVPSAVVYGEHYVDDALADGRGIVFATAHTAGWDLAGRLLGRDKGLSVMIVEAPERDADARAVQDEARREYGLVASHVGDDPLSALRLAKQLREGGAVALQVDRTPRGRKARSVRLFGEAGQIPEGPLRLAALTGAPIVPIFAARTGHRRYEIVAAAAIRLARSATERDWADAAQRIADALEQFIRAHPTQWFHFRED
jgi:phosphatidylinositol dimannoside acyltransferase